MVRIRWKNHLAAHRCWAFRQKRRTAKNHLAPSKRNAIGMVVFRVCSGQDPLGHAAWWKRTLSNCGWRVWTTRSNGGWRVGDNSFSESVAPNFVDTTLTTVIAEIFEKRGYDVWSDVWKVHSFTKTCVRRKQSLVWIGVTQWEPLRGVEGMLRLAASPTHRINPSHCFHINSLWCQISEAKSATNRHLVVTFA